MNRKVIIWVILFFIIIGLYTFGEGSIFIEGSRIIFTSVILVSFTLYYYIDFFWTKSEHFDDSPKLFNFSKPSKCSFWRSEISKLLKFELFGQGVKWLDFPREYAPIAIFLPYPLRRISSMFHLRVVNGTNFSEKCAVQNFHKSSKMLKIVSWNSRSSSQKLKCCPK